MESCDKNADHSIVHPTSGSGGLSSPIPTADSNEASFALPESTPDHDLSQSLSEDEKEPHPASSSAAAAPDAPRRAPGVPRSQKKHAKRAQIEQHRDFERQKKRQRQKERHRFSLEEEYAGLTKEQRQLAVEKKRAEKEAHSEKIRAHLEQSFESGRPKIAINCSLCDDMTVKEVKSLRKQIELSYSVLKNSHVTFQLHLTSFGEEHVLHPGGSAGAVDGAAKDLQESTGAAAGAAAASSSSASAITTPAAAIILHNEETTNKDSTPAPVPHQQSESPSRPAVSSSTTPTTLFPEAGPTIPPTSLPSRQFHLIPPNQSFALLKWRIHLHSVPYWEAFPNDKIVVLSPDAEEVLDSVDEDCVYILGGSVDRTVIRNQTLDQSNLLLVSPNVWKRCRLPIKEAAPKGSTKVLNIDTVVRIISQRFAAGSEHLQCSNIDSAGVLGGKEGEREGAGAAGALSETSLSIWREVLATCLPSRYKGGAGGGAGGSCEQVVVSSKDREL